jgi:hypothetical protein
MERLPGATGNSMKVRGLIFILASIPAWVYLFWWLNRSTPSNRFELGSVAMPYPPLASFANMFAVLGTLIGVVLLLFDLAQWTRKKSHKATIR